MKRILTIIFLFAVIIGYGQNGQGVENATNVSNPFGYTKSQSLGLFQTKAGMVAYGIIGTGTSGNVPFWADVDSLGSDTNFFWDNTNKRLIADARSIPGNSSTTGSIVFAGDSRTVGFNGSTAYEWTNNITHPTGSSVYNVARLGDNSQQALNLGWTAVDPLFHPRATNNIVILWVGYNDSPTSIYIVEAHIAQYCRERHALGWKVLVTTETSASWVDPYRNALNALLKANWWQYADGIVDLAADTRIGADLAYSNLTYFAPDGVHLTDAGYDIVESIMQAALNQFVASSTRTMFTHVNIGNTISGHTFGEIKTSADTGGYLQIQSIKDSGAVWGILSLNPSGGNVNIGGGPVAPQKLTVMGDAAQSSLGLYAFPGSGNSDTKNWGFVTNYYTYGDFSIMQSVAQDGNTIGGTPRLYFNKDGDINNVGPETSVKATFAIIKDNPAPFSDFSQFKITGATDINKEFLIGFETTNNYAYLQTIALGSSFSAYNLALQPVGGNVGIGYETGTEIANNKLAVNGQSQSLGVLITPSDTTGFGTIANVGLMKYKTSDNHLYLFTIVAALHVWVLIK